ncbi:osmotically-inducible protein OsmY [Orenia metallireducens]|jgi:osmotically-inducible protein OsmY|uniref:Osmotically-inducible protein OsmY, contains BON domain n=1 Tax=Orenia metallireducens TaxID=1413210 RepID=A0A285GF86_9FIRM|nr:BON domain-containing protein [Orenia metallireducens]PRX30390.1 osmotically-inducible protein OsmY [Orenia metallireducens]SNY22237.1 Osmotically-inducible protein OsmY, contains BON domain [Orenia metallireducens]
MLRLDEQIKKDVIDQLYWDSRVDASNINVKVDQGRVTLTGTVPTYFANSSAVNSVWAVEGVKDLNNQLEIKYPQSIVRPTDNEVEAKVENRIMDSPDIGIQDININVDAGWVKLEGSVDTYWKRIYVEDIISKLNGVRGIENKLTVVPSEDYLDKNIADKVSSALERNMYVNENKINVKVEDGVVTLSGKLRNQRAIQEAFESAYHTIGVKDVDDQFLLAS